jgi:hypothetical protein
MLDLPEKGIPFFWIVTEFVAQNAEGARSVAKLFCDFMRREPLDEESP